MLWFLPVTLCATTHQRNVSSRLHSLVRHRGLKPHEHDGNECNPAALHELERKVALLEAQLAAVNQAPAWSAHTEGERVSEESSAFVPVDATPSTCLGAAL